MLHIKKTLLIRLISLLLFISLTFPFVIAGSPGAKGVGTTKQSFLLRVPLNTPELRNRQQEALKAIRSPIDAHFVAEEMVVGGVTYIGDGGREVIRIFNPASVLSEEEIMQKLREMAREGDIFALEALDELKSTLFFSVHERVLPKEYRNFRIISRVELWMLRLDKMKEHDIKKCLWSLKKDTKISSGLKKAIVKKLIKLQQKRPETIAIIRAIALVLLKSDENNFREALEPFIGDYIAIMDAIRRAGIHDKAESVNMFYEILGYVAHIDERFALKTAEAAKDTKGLQELRDLYRTIIPEVIATIDRAIHSYFEGRYNITIRDDLGMSDLEETFPVSKIMEDWGSDNISTHEIAKAIKFQKQSGGFKVTFTHISPSFDIWEHDDVSYVGSGGSNLQTYGNTVTDKGRIKEIQILPPDSTGTNKAEIKSRGLRDQV